MTKIWAFSFPCKCFYLWGQFFCHPEKHVDDRLTVTSLPTVTFRTAHSCNCRPARLSRERSSACMYLPNESAVPATYNIEDMYLSVLICRRLTKLSLSSLDNADLFFDSRIGELYVDPPPPAVTFPHGRSQRTCTFRFAAHFTITLETLSQEPHGVAKPQASGGECFQPGNCWLPVCE